MRLFVYGSLMRGFANNRLLTGCQYFGVDETVESNWDMLSFSDFPAVVESETGVRIGGEVYEIDRKALAKIDVLESNGVLYQRRPVKLARTGMAQMYVLMPNIVTKDCRRIIELDGGFGQAPIKRWGEFTPSIGEMR